MCYLEKGKSLCVDTRINEEVVEHDISYSYGGILRPMESHLIYEKFVDDLIRRVELCEQK